MYVLEPGMRSLAGDATAVALCWIGAVSITGRSGVAVAGVLTVGFVPDIYWNDL